MLKRGQIKKHIYRSMGVRRVSVKNIYMKFWPSLMPYVKKYHCFNGHPMRFDNCSIYRTALEYVQHGNKIFDHLEDLVFIKHVCDYYKVTKVSRKRKLLKRLIRVVKSIQKYGYAKGRYSKQYIGLAIGVNPYFGNVRGYELISGKHRAAAVFALGCKKVKCEIFTRLKSEF